MKRAYKNNIFLFLIFCVIGLVQSSCEKFLDVIPKDQVTGATVWQTKQNADLFLNDIYNCIESPYGAPLSEAPRENFSDNAINSIAGRYDKAVYNISAYTPDYSNPSWGKAHEWNQYDYIRKCNVFIKNVSKSNLDENWKLTRLAEARFLRVFFYQKIWTTMGAFPVITDVLNFSEQGDDIFVPRGTDQECFEFMDKELEEIANDLPIKAEQNGRATKGAALTLKGWIELYYASPLHNPSNDKARWTKAANTYKEVIDMNQYKLFPEYYDMFLEQNNYNSEVIFQTPSDPNLAKLQNRYSYMVAISYLDNVFSGFNLSTPTQDLVDEYSMANGLPISDPASGYDPQNPYVGREKRFYETILYDGASWKGAVCIMKQGVGSKNATNLSDNNEGPVTGYNWRKMVDPKYQIVGNADNKAGWIWYRYAEVLLGYAEARNEADGPDASVYDAINQVRNRGDLPDLPAGLSQEEMRTIIIRERRVELALEEKRWYDLLRLKLAEDKLNGYLHAMLIEKINGDWVYKTIPAASGERIFNERNYFLPIPQAAIDRNPKLTQNPGY